MKWQIGDVTVTKIVELETTGGSRFILPQATREAILPISWRSRTSPTRKVASR